MGMSLSISTLGMIICVAVVFCVAMSYVFWRRRKRQQLKSQKVVASVSKTNENCYNVEVPIADDPPELVFRDETDTRFEDVQNLVVTAKWMPLRKGGTLGPLYKWLLHNGSFVAARQLEKNLTPSRKALTKCFDVLINLRHGNLLPLRCVLFYDNLLYLVYDYLCLGSLDEILHGIEGIDGNCFTPLGWTIRACVALGTARGVASLHCSAGGLVCGVVKSSNVLLKTDFRACLSGYELPFLADAAAIVARNPGAVAPELLRKDTPPVFTQKSDMYSLGVLLLELVTGRRPRTQAPNGREMDLREFVDSHMKGIRVFDPVIERDATTEEEMRRMLAIAGECLKDAPEARPTIGHVVRKLKQLRRDSRRPIHASTSTSTSTSPPDSDLDLEAADDVSTRWNLNIFSS